MTKTKAAKLRAKAAKAAVKAVVVSAPPSKSKKKPKVVVLEGRGDYRPTPYNMNRVKGHGDYSSTGSRILGGLGSAVGGTLGGVADLLSGGFKAITGMGDYRTKGPKRNSLFAGGVAPMKMGAMNAQFAGGPPSVQHREFVGPVVAPSDNGFHTTVYRIQPGLTGQGSLFPWLSSVASCFQQYEMEGLILEYVSTSSEFSSQVAVGSVMMSTLYDAEASPLSSQVAVDNNEFTTTSKPSESFIHPVELAPSESTVSIRYVRSSNASSASSEVLINSRLDDVGLFQVSMAGIPSSVPAGTQLGELWVTYDCKLYKPALPDLHNGTTYVAYRSSVSGQTVETGSWTVDPRSSLPVTINSGSNGWFGMPINYNGMYIAIHQAFSPVTGYQSGGSLSLGPNLVPVDLFTNNTSGTPGLNVIAGVTDTGQWVSVNIAAFVTDASIGGQGTGIFLSPLYFTGGGAVGERVIIIPVDSDFALAPLASLFADLGRGEAQKMSRLIEALRLTVALPSSSPSCSVCPEKGSDPSSTPPKTCDSRRLSLGEVVDLGSLHVPSVPADVPGVDPSVVSRVLTALGQR